MLNNLVKNLQNKPLKARKKIMWACVGGCGLVIFLFWLVMKPNNVNKKEENNEWETFKKELAEEKEKLSLNNISSEISKFTGDISKKIEKEGKVKESEMPRLPLEIN